MKYDDASLARRRRRLERRAVRRKAKRVLEAMFPPAEICLYCLGSTVEHRPWCQYRDSSGYMSRTAQALGQSVSTTLDNIVLDSLKAK